MPRKTKAQKLAELEASPLGSPAIVTLAEPAPPAPPEPISHVARLDRPVFPPVPEGFMPVWSNREVGIRVLKSHDKMVAAIQFASNRTPDRAEKDILERVGMREDGLNHIYRLERKQWERYLPDGMPIGENVIDTVRIADGLALERLIAKQLKEDQRGI